MFDYIIFKDGLLINEALSEILSVKLIIESRGEAFDQIEISLDDLQNRGSFIRVCIENLVKEDCIQLRAE